MAASLRENVVPCIACKEAATRWGTGLALAESMNTEVSRKHAVRLAKAFIGGGIAGFAGTIPMTAFMLLAHRLMPKSLQYALPPEKIVDRIAKRVGLRRHMDEPKLLSATLVSHLGYGASMGSVFGEVLAVAPFRLNRPRMSLYSAISGIAFGLLVWAAGYLGWLPAVGLLQSATKAPRQRSVLMVSAHVVWGATTGFAVWLLQRVAGDTPER